MRWSGQKVREVEKMSVYRVKGKVIPIQAMEALRVARG
jgi:hypothetical protein